jgi:outer membrane lipoprotein carrier protein
MHVRHIFVLRLVGLVLCAGVFASADSKTDGLISKVQGRYNGARTLSVNFIERYGVLGHERVPEMGTLTLRKQGKMRWDYTRPAGKVFVSDGKNVFLYTAGDNRVEKVPLKDTEDMRAPLAFLLGRLEMKKEFGSFSVRSEEAGEWLEASAKSDRVPYKKVQMLIAQDGSIRVLEVVGRDESLLSFSFSGEKINPPIDERVFHFTIPAGAEVVDSVEFNSRGFGTGEN